MARLERFQSRIEAFSKVRRGIANAALAYGLGIHAAIAAILALLLLSGWLPGAFLNLLLFLALFAYLIALGVLYVRRRQRFKTHMDEAFRMEDLQGDLNSRIISALDFLQRGEVRELTGIVIDTADADLRRDYEAKLDRQERNHRRKRFFVLLTVLVLLALLPWFGPLRMLRNFRSSLLAAHEALFPVHYQVLPGYGEHVYLIGSEVDVVIEFEDDKFQTVRLIETIDEEETRHKLQVDSSGRALHRVRGLTEAVRRFRFEFGERRTQDVVLVFSDYPVLENMQTELVYPAYTRMLPKTLEGVQGRLFCLEGTKITLGFTFSKELERATIQWDDEPQGLPLDVVGRFASATVMHNRTRRATLQVVDEHGFELQQGFDIAFEVQRDEKPEVMLPGHLKQEMPTLAEGLKLFGFGVRLRDDYGVSRCVLKWTKSTIDNPSAVTRKGDIERLISPPRRKAVVAFEKVFEHVPVQPGDRISFYVEVYDNKPESQRGSSSVRSLFVYQQDLEGLAIARLGFGRGGFTRSRLPKSKRATSVKAPMAMRTDEKVWNEYEADIETATKPPRIRGEHARAVKEYFKLLSTAVYEQEKEEKTAAEQE